MTQLREILARLQLIDDAHADGAHDYGHELYTDLKDDLEQLIANRERAVGDL